MGNYIPNSPSERQKMLETIGIPSTDALFAHIPPEVRAGRLDLPDGLSEFEVRRRMEGLAAKNQVFRSIFRGAGAYWHYIPAIVKSVSAKEEFLTAYTPYQAEISQGILQSIFEYQTMICELTGMDVSNASMYDGASAAAEAAAMCRDRKRKKILVSDAVDPQTRAAVETYAFGSDTPVGTVALKGGCTDPEALRAALTPDVSCVLLQQPNFFGLIEDTEALVALAHEAGAKVVLSANPISLGLLASPGEQGADIAVGEGQPLGLPLAFGGPYLGFLACTKAMMRKLPGRIVGETTDVDGQRAFVLTLQAREQHIRREKASSNICSNQALCALTAAAYLSAMGPGGLREVAEQCTAKAHYAAARLCEIGGVSLAYDRPFFHEFVTRLPASPDAVLAALADKGILGGLPVRDGILWCVTEMCTKEQIDEMAGTVREVCEI